MEEKKIIKRVSGVTISGNVILTFFKLFAGIFGYSGAMISDAIHSLSDIVTTFIAWFGTKLSLKEADKEHPYGHERLESIASMILGAVLLITAGGIGLFAAKIIFSGDYREIKVPNVIALIAAVVSIIIKEAMYHYTMHYARKINSAAFTADAWHHRSDALSSIGSLLGIGAAILGVPIFEPIASFVICICILKVSYDILKDSVIKMIDVSCNDEFENEIKKHILSNEEVVSLDILRTRMFGNKIYVEAEISVDKNMKLEQAHNISQKIHDSIEKKFKNVKHIMIHVNPA